MAAELVRVEKADEAMGATFSVALYGTSRGKLETAAAAALDEAQRFDSPGVELDPGGIGKGYAVDCMVDVLKRNGVESALVSAAGSSIYGMGAPPGEPGGWRITIRDPHDPTRAAAEVLLKNMSLST